MMQPLFLKLNPDNYTDLARTPWAGTRIARELKSGLLMNPPVHIGESWEFSASSELPSRCTGPFDGTMIQMLENEDLARIWLSEEHRKIWGNHSPLLLKYIDADYDLSLQLHPPIEDQSLKPGESGKWEAWFVLCHEPDAGIYLGLAPGVTKKELIDVVRNHGDIKPMLHFVKVQSGDLYTIPPRMIHALGAGVCVLEPQVMQPGKRAVSLRLHDWNRRYDEAGNLCRDGKMRPLHIDTALQYIDFDTLRGEQLAQKCRTRAHVTWRHDDLTIWEMAPAPCLVTRIYSGSGSHEEPFYGELTSILAMQGAVDIWVNDEMYHLSRGESGVIAASAEKINMICHQAHIAISYCVPELYRAATSHQP